MMKMTKDPNDHRVTIFWYGDDDDDEWIRLHLAAAHSTGLTVFEVAKIAEAIVAAERDPLPPEELGEPFRFFADDWDPSQPFDVADLWYINPVVPPPNARVDLDRAMAEFKKDVERCKRLLEHHASELSLEWLSAIHRNLLNWSRFWAVRHSDPAMRARLAREIEDSQPERTEMAALTEKLIRRAQCQ